MTQGMLSHRVWQEQEAQLRDMFGSSFDTARAEIHTSFHDEMEWKVFVDGVAVLLTTVSTISGATRHERLGVHAPRQQDARPRRFTGYCENGG